MRPSRTGGTVPPANATGALAAAPVISIQSGTGYVVVDQSMTITPAYWMLLPCGDSNPADELDAVTPPILTFQDNGYGNVWVIGFASDLTTQLTRASNCVVN